MNKNYVQHLDWQWVEENPERALELMVELYRENAALRSLVQHWYKLVPENIRSSIEDAQK